MLRNASVFCVFLYDLFVIHIFYIILKHQTFIHDTTTSPTLNIPLPSNYDHPTSQQHPLVDAPSYTDLKMHEAHKEADAAHTAASA